MSKNPTDPTPYRAFDSLKDFTEAYTKAEDAVLTSPSAAAGVVLGRSANGPSRMEAARRLSPRQNDAQGARMSNPDPSGGFHGRAMPQGLSGEVMIAVSGDRES